MTRRAAIAALAVAFAAFAQARGEWVTEVVTNEYDGVEWLENNNNASFINTVISQYSTTKIYIDFQATTPSPWKEFCGPSISFARNEYGCAFGCESSFPVMYAYSNPGIISVVFNGDYNRNVWCIDAPRSALYKNGNKQTDIAINFTVSTNPILLPGRAAGKTYRGWIENGSFVRDFIPILLNDVGYMYDRVSGQLFGNAGTGSFTYGSITGKVAGATYITTNRVYRAPAPMRSFDAQHPFNNAAARTRLGGTGNGEDGTTLRPTAHIAIKRNEED